MATLLSFPFLKDEQYLLFVHSSIVVLIHVDDDKLNPIYAKHWCLPCNHKCQLTSKNDHCHISYLITGWQ